MPRRPGSRDGIHRDSRPKVFCKKHVLKNFPKFTGKHLCQSLFLNKVGGLWLQACKFIKSEILTQVFSCEFCEIFKNTFIYRTPLLDAPAYRLKSWTVSEKLIIYQNLGKRANFQCTLLYLRLGKNFWSLSRAFYPYSDIYVKWEKNELSKKQACEERCLMNRILRRTGIYRHLIYEWIHLKERGVTILLVLWAT